MLFEQLAIDRRIPDRIPLNQVVRESDLPENGHRANLRKVRDEYLNSVTVYPARTPQPVSQAAPLDPARPN